MLTLLCLVAQSLLPANCSAILTSSAPTQPLPPPLPPTVWCGTTTTPAWHIFLQLLKDFLAAIFGIIGPSNIKRAENHLLWPIVALVDQEPACRYLENGRLLSNKILHFSILYSKNDHSSGFSELLCFFKILRFLHICLYFFIIHLSFSKNPELFPELHHHQSCLKLVIYTSYFLVSLLDHHRNLSFLRSSSSKVRICRQMGWKYWKYTCCNCWVPCQKTSHSQGNIYTVLLYHAHYRFHQEHLLFYIWCRRITF